MNDDKSKWFKIQCFNHKFSCYESKIFLDSDEGLNWAYEKQEKCSPIYAAVGHLVNGRFDENTVSKHIGNSLMVDFESGPSWTEIFAFIIRNSKNSTK